MARNNKLLSSLGNVASMGQMSSMRKADVRGTVRLAGQNMNKARGNMRTASSEYFPVAQKQYKQAKKNYYSLGKKYGF